MRVAQQVVQGLTLRTLENLEILLKKLKTIWVQCFVFNDFLALAVKNEAKTDIEDIWVFSNLVYFFSFCQMLCPVL